MSGSSNLTNGSEWELSKENIQPLKQGRKVANLSAALGDSSNEYQSKLHREIQVFETAIRTYEGDDLLEVWYRYFLWLCENFPTGGKDQDVLLERCITVFKDEEQYKNDERYLKIWLRYADLSQDPVIVYEYMHSQEICDKLAPFYEYWAYVFEGLGNIKKADELYNLGKAKNAQPLDILQRQHRAFEIRIAENLSRSPTETPQEDENQRTALGGLKSRGKKGTVGVKRTGNATTASKGGVGQPAQSNKRTGFAIFNENAASEIRSTLPPSTGEWQMPPSRPIVTKENTQKPGKWNEAKLSQRYHRSVPVDNVGIKPSFTVHEDEESTENPSFTPQCNYAMVDQVLSSRKPGKDATNQLLKSITKTTNDDTKFKVMYCKGIIYAGAKEFSFEQLRAARMFARLNGQPWSSLYPQQNPKKTQFKVMYPKDEVYPMDSGERPFEEVLLKRYFASKEKQRKLVQIPDIVSSCPESPMEVNRSALNVSQILEQMDISEGHKSAAKQSSAPFEVYSDAETKCSSQTARRGLSFNNGKSEEPLNVNRIYQDPELPEPLSASPVQSLTASGGLSAFHSIPKGLSRTPLGQRPGPSEESKVNDVSTTRPNITFPDTVPANRLPGNVPEMQHGFQPLPGTSNLPCINQPPFGATMKFQRPGPSEESRVNNVSTTRPSITFPDTVPANRLPGNVPEMQHGFQPLPGASNLPCIIQPRFGAVAPINRSGMNNFGGHTPHTPSGVDNYMASPTVTMNTRAAQDVVMAMFNNPLGFNNDEAMPWIKPQEISCTAQDFEAAFKNENKMETAPTETSTQGFTIFDETAADSRRVPTQEATQEENQENRPPSDYFQEKTNRPIAGVLQPSLGIPVCPKSEDEENDQVGEDDENLPPRCYHGDSHVYSKTMCDITEDANNFMATSSFKLAARMASTPYSEQGMEPPVFDLSNINDPMGYAANTFACTPNKALSPIFERSDEDTRSTASSSSSTASSGRGSVSQHISLATKLESIVEDHRSVSEARKSIVSEDRPRPEDQIVSKNHEEVESTSRETKDVTTDVNPFSDEVVEELLKGVVPRVSSYDGYFMCNDNLPHIADKLAIDLGEDDLYQVKNLIGSGAFAKVYCADKLHSEMNADDNDKTEVTLKVQKTPNDWEFYICRQLHSRIKNLQCTKETHAMFMDPSKIYNYANGSVLVDQFNCSLGTLLDVANMYKTTTKCTEEIAVLVIVRLLRMLLTMHRCSIIHGDIKPDNILLLESTPYTEMNLKLIDFGRSIDMHLFPPGTMFTVNCFTEGFQCMEMKKNLPWTIQVDTYGVLGVMYCLIHGEYLKVYRRNGHHAPIKSFKRHWNVVLWNQLFDLLLNTPNPRELSAHCEMLLQEFIDYSADTVIEDEIASLEKCMKSSPHS